MSEARLGDMAAYVDRTTKKPKTVLVLVYRWSGRDDALATLIDGDLRRYRAFIDSVTRVEGYGELRHEIEKRLAERKGKRAKQATESDTSSVITPESRQAERRNHPSPHDMPFKIQDEPNGDINPSLWRYIGRGGFERAWMNAQREHNPLYWERVILPNARGTQPGAKLHALIAGSKRFEKGKGKPWGAHT